MYEKDATFVQLQPQFTVTEPSRVKVDTLTQVGFNSLAASLVSRSKPDSLLDADGRGARVVDQRNAPMAPTARRARHQPEWQALAMLGQPPGAFLGKSLPQGWTVCQRSPALTPLPLDPAVVRDGPRPSGWGAIKALGLAHPRPTECVMMRNVLQAMVEDAARGPPAARGPCPSLDKVLKPSSADLIEFAELIKGWKKESADYKASDEYKELKEQQDKAKGDAKAAEVATRADAMAVEAERAAQQAKEQPSDRERLRQ